ncbi:hypothetical protein BASH2_04249 [Bacillus anthracis]|nr:hypothetical protein BASH2_04249 [Bacillus anthracis]
MFHLTPPNPSPKVISYIPWSNAYKTFPVKEAI